MTVLHYRAVDSKGQVVEESDEAPSVDALANILETRGLILISADVAGSGTSRTRSGRRVLRTRDLAMFSRQLASMLRAGVPVAEAVQSLGSQASDEQRDLMDAISMSLRQGDSLSVALAAHPKDFPVLFSATVAAAERVGALEQAFLQLSDMLVWELKLKREVKSALRYPATVVGAMVLAVIVLQQVVVPQFARIFDQLGGNLPLPTRVLVGSTEFMAHYWWAVLLGLGAFTWAFRRSLRTKVGRLRFDQFILKVPLFGTLLKKTFLARFARMFSVLQGNGLPILGALEVLTDTTGNAQISREIDDVHTRLTQGETLSEAINQQPSFDPLVKSMIRVGEKSGQLDETMRSVSEFYDDETRTSIGNLTQWIEPILTLVLGGFVLFLALAIFLPWWDMTGLYRK